MVRTSLKVVLPPLPISAKPPPLNSLSHLTTAPVCPVRDSNGVLWFSQIEVEPPADSVPPTDTNPGSTIKPAPPESNPTIALQPDEWSTLIKYSPGVRLENDTTLVGGANTKSTAPNPTLNIVYCENGGLPSFNVMVTVPSLSPVQVSGVTT